MSQTHSNPIEESSGLQFKYQLGFDARRNALLIRILDGEKSVTRFEKYGIHVLSLQDRYHSSSKLDPVHRHFVQHLLRFGKVDSWENIYVVPRVHAGYFLQRLSRFKNVASFIPSKPLAFSKQILVPQFQFKGKNFSQFELEVSLRDKEEGKKVSFEDLQVFSGSRTWILIKGVFFAVEDIDIEHLLESMNSKGFINLEGEAAAQFVEKDLEGLLERKLLQLPKSILLPSVERHLPKAQYEFSEEDSEEALTLKLHFLYGEHSLPPFEHEKNSLASVEKDKKVYLVCRRIGFEKDILERLQDQGFSRVGIDLFQNVGERALDFVSEKLPSFQNDSEVLGLSQLRRYRIDAYLGIDQLKVKKETRGMNWLGFDLKYQVGSWEVSFDFVRESLKAGKRYLRIPGGGVARIVEEDIRRLEETFEELGGRWNDQGLLEVQSFHAPYLDEMLQIDWKEESEFEKGIKSLRKLTEISETPLPENLKAVLRPYQHHGYSWMNFLHEHQFHGILADDMGLGKTLQALTFLKNLKDQKGSRPNLVLAPTSVVFNWAAEAEKFTPDLKVVQLSGIERKGMYDQIEGADLVLTSYAIFRRDAEILSKRDWRVVILDEAQYIKNFRSKTASLVKELKAEQRMALTGTPLENRLSELWSIIDFLIPNFLGNYSLFQRRYQKPIEDANDLEALGRLKKRLHPFIMRRQKEDVAPELPPKTEIDQYCEMTPAQRKIYEQILNSSRKTLFKEVEQKGIEKSHLSILTALLRLRQVCCHPHLVSKADATSEEISGKFELFQQLLQEIISEGHRVVVFSQFVEMLKLLKGWLESQSIRFEYLDGRTRKRQDHIKNFQSDSSIPVFLISLKAGGTGLNLSEADYVIHYDPWWNPAVQDQATDRVHRIGQKQHVFAYKLITKDSVEEKILSLQGRKRDLFKGVLSADSAFGKKLSYEDLEYLFS